MLVVKIQKKNYLAIVLTIIEAVPKTCVEAQVKLNGSPLFNETREYKMDNYLSFCDEVQRSLKWQKS